MVKPGTIYEDNCNLAVTCTLFIFYKNVVFPAQAEYLYLSADFRMYWGINYKCSVSIASASFFVLLAGFAV